MTPRQISEFYRILQQGNPEPRTELHYNSPFQLLIAVMLSAQATDKSVNKATAGLFALAPDAASMAALPEETLINAIKTIGLFRTKARHVLATCHLLCERHGGAVPDDREALEALPGVGRKTANVVLNTAFHHPTIAVDTHIFRVCNRTGLAAGKTVREVEDKLWEVTPPTFRLNAHHWLILHGRYVCTARKPHCDECPVAQLCPVKITV